MSSARFNRKFKAAPPRKTELPARVLVDTAFHRAFFLAFAHRASTAFRAESERSEISQGLTRSLLPQRRIEQVR